MFKEYLNKLMGFDAPNYGKTINSHTNDDWKHRLIEWHTPVGVPYVRQYVEMLESPHLLIAGSTGSGKSTVLNGILMTALVKNLPNEAQFIMIDPKRVELSPYKHLPHTYKFVSSAEAADETLKLVCAYMHKEYDEMEERGIRKSDKFHLYIVIDELATLLLTPPAPLKKSIMTSLQEILQMGRAANIHVIACTQSPSRKTLPAELVINFTNRIALHCASAIESRQILNKAGAEEIPLASGQAIYMNYHGECTKLSGLPCFSDAEINNIIDFWEEQKHQPAYSVGYNVSNRLPIHR